MGRQASQSAARHRRILKRPESQLSAYRRASYNSALVYDIALGAGPGKNRVPEEALLLNHLLLNLTPSSSTLAYRSGLSVGSTLYEIELEAHPRPTYGEYAPYLVEFLERAGYRVTYSIFPDQFVFRLHGAGVYLGARIHTFEAGIIAGFLSAAKHAYISVAEQECRNAGARECTFTTSTSATRMSMSRDSISRFVGHMQDIASRGASQGGAFSQSYHALVSSMVLDNVSMDTLKGLMEYMGSSLRTGFDSMQGSKLGKAKYVSNAMSALGLGTPSIGDMRKLGIKLSFSRSTARHGWVEISVAFLDGILGKSAVGAVATESNKNNPYTITLARRPEPRTH